MGLVTSLRNLHRNPKDLDEIFEIMRIMNRGSHKKNYHRLLKSDAGGRIAYDRVELEPKLMDREWLAQFPDGSVGSAYRSWVQSEAISAEQLANASLRRVTYFRKPHPYIWLARKIRDCHDIWHVLGGYGTDKLGESCLVAFTYKQTGGRGWLLVAMNALFTVLTRGKGKKKWIAWKAIMEGFERGERADYLLEVDYEKLFSMPLEQARSLLNIQPAYHYDQLMSMRRK